MAAESKGLELVPADIFIPAKPIPDSEWVARRLGGERGQPQAARSIDLRGIETCPTSVAEAAQVASVVFKNLERAIRDRDRPQIWKMLRDRPELIMVPNVCHRLARWILSGSLRPPRGRPRGANTWSPLVVAALVQYLMSNGSARNRDEAFSRLEALGLTYESAKRLYFQASREPRFQALLIVDEDKARPVEDGELRWMAGADRLSPERAVTRTQYDPVLGDTVEMEFRATK